MRIQFNVVQHCAIVSYRIKMRSFYSLPVLVSYPIEENPLFSGYSGFQVKFEFNLGLGGIVNDWGDSLSRNTPVHFTEKIAA